MATIEQVRERLVSIAELQQRWLWIPHLALALLDEHEAPKDEWHMPTCTCEWCESRRRVERLIEEM